MKVKNKNLNKVLMNFMAYSRESFKDHLEEKILGGLHEYSKCILARKCQLSDKNFKDPNKYIEHWCNEYSRLIGGELLVQFSHSTKSSFDKNKALNQVIEYCKSIISNFITVATNVIKRDYKLDKLPASLNESDFDHFWSIINVNAPTDLKSELKFINSLR